MTNRLVWMETDNICPCRNLTMEEYMTLHASQGTCILYLQQNRHTVVIRKNQNRWRECRVSLLEQENGYSGRRLSGGGTVFHDLGNLNFTSVMGAGDYGVSWQLDVILEAIRSLGVHAGKTGRNDITVDERKFSGNVFYRTGDGCYHHGTILIQADKEDMSRCLNVSKKKLASKGVTSVKSRVANPCEFKSDITLEEVKSALVEAFSRVYGQPAMRMEEGELLQPDIDARAGKFTSWQWKYGRKIPFKYEMGKRFPRGNVQIQSYTDGNMIQDANVSSGVTDQGMIGMLTEQFKDHAYTEEDIYRAVKTMGTDTSQAGEYASVGESQPCRVEEDIMTLVRESLQTQNINGKEVRFIWLTNLIWW